MPVPAALAAMTQGGMGMVIVTTTDATAPRLFGIFTDGDLRRAMARLGDLRTSHGRRCHDAYSHRSIEAKPTRGGSGGNDGNAQGNPISSLVIDDQGKLRGALNMHDLFRAKVV
jgi:arabinose-5-phosphate isomerase